MSLPFVLYSHFSVDQSLRPCGECIRRGEGGEEWRGKKDTGYLYKAFIVARVAFPFLKNVDPLTLLCQIRACFAIH